MQSGEVKKLFAELEEIKTRLDKLDTNGDLEEIKSVVNRWAANTAGFEATVNDHGSRIYRMMQILERLERRCPLMKPETDEFEKVCCDGEPEAEER